MSPIPQPDPDAGPRASSPLLDVMIRAGLIGALAVLCYQVFAPFLSLTAWSTILAVTMYPFHRWLARRAGGRQWIASTILIVIGFLLIIIPTALLTNSFADSVRSFIGAVQTNTLVIPAPPEGVERWPIVGKKVHDVWSQASAAACCCFWARFSSPVSPWRTVKQARAASERFSSGSRAWQEARRS